jgi:predicted nucleotidyltransferase component of viral defense system
MTEDTYLKLSRRERAELLDDVSRKRNLAPAILEKDYWVCLTLGALFSLPEIGEHLVFKGGTSLSKVYGLIDRFSEDVDVSFHRDYLGFTGDDRDPELATSNKQQKQRIEDL